MYCAASWQRGSCWAAAGQERVWLRTKPKQTRQPRVCSACLFVLCCHTLLAAGACHARWPTPPCLCLFLTAPSPACLFPVSAPCHGCSGSGVAASTVPTFDILKANFDAAYGGNRAPFPIFIHTPWLQSKDHTPGLQRFIGECGLLPLVQSKIAEQLTSAARLPAPPLCGFKDAVLCWAACLAGAGLSWSVMCVTSQPTNPFLFLTLSCPVQWSCAVQTTPSDCLTFTLSRSASCSTGCSTPLQLTS